MAARFAQRLSDESGPLSVAPGEASVVAKYRPQGERLWSRTVLARVAAVAARRDRHVLIAGTFEGSVDLGGGPLTAGEFPTGVFLGELDAAGRHVWSRAYPLEYTSWFDPRRLRVDRAGNLAMGGLLRGAIYFGTAVIVADNSAVLLHLDARGNFQWGYDGESRFAEASDFALDEDDNLYLAGTWASDLYPPIDRIPFVYKFSPTGEVLWRRELGTVAAQGHAVGVHGNRVVLTGAFSSPLTFAGTTLSPRGGNEGFLVGFSRAGDERWIRRLGFEGLDLVMAPLDDVTVVGRYRDGDTLGSGAVPGVPGSDTNLFVAQFDRNEGNALRARAFPMAHPSGVFTGADRYRVSAEEHGTVAFLGGLIAPLDVGPVTLEPDGLRDLFLLVGRP
ncbi:hypothetical protein KRR26_32415 [Corallococcus sp. M34]|nr:hypothetical protein [Citreicoccus inhibens]